MIIFIWVVIVIAATLGGYFLGKSKNQEIPGLLICMGTSILGVLVAGILGGLLLGGVGIAVTALALPPKERAQSPARGPSDLGGRLAELDELRRQGLISEQEHRAARAKALGLDG